MNLNQFRRTLLLNHNYEALHFIVERRAIKLFMNDKVEVLSTWEDSFRYLNRDINYPAILRLKKSFKRPARTLRFSRLGVFKRDAFICQYCGDKLSKGNVTMDHVTPKYNGGLNSFLNCVTCCSACNLKKGRKSLAESGLSLIRQPVIPNIRYLQPLDNFSTWHQDWDFYINISA